MEDLSRYYLEKFRHFKNLTKEEEEELWHNFDRKKQIEVIIASHAKLVLKYAFAYKKYNLPVNDLVQEGMIGLMRAIEKYNPVSDIRFSSYARWWIKAMMHDFLLKNWSIVKNAAKGQKDHFKDVEVQNHDFTSSIKKDLSLDHTVTDDDGASLIDLLSIEYQSSEDFFIEEQANEEKSVILKKVLKVLSPLEQKVLQMKFYKKFDSVTAAEKLNLSVLQFNKIQTAALRKLFFYLKDHVDLLRKLR